MATSTNTFWPVTPIVLGGNALIRDASRDEFFAFCQANGEYRFERTSQGDLVIMTPTGGDTGRRNFRLYVPFGIWCDQDGTGIAFDSSTGFWLRNGALRSPDLSWVRRERYEALTSDEQKKYPPIAPDFIAELRSESDRISHLHDKMQEWADNGVRLGWLIDPVEKRVEIYRPGNAPEILEAPAHVSGDPELPGFVLDMAKIW